MFGGLLGSSRVGDSSCLSQQASNHILVTSVAKRPRAVVVIFGHIGTNFDQMNKYAKLYHDRNCSTICATAPILSLASHDESIIGDIATTACRETARLVRMGELSEMGYGNVPVVVQVLGNGGCQVLEVLEQRVLEVISRERLDLLLKRKQRLSGLGTPSLSRRSKVFETNTPTKSNSTRSVLTTSTKSDENQELCRIERRTIKESILNCETEETLSIRTSSETSSNYNGNSSQRIVTPPTTPAGCVVGGPTSLNELIPKCTSQYSSPDMTINTKTSNLVTSPDVSTLQHRYRRRRKRSAPQVKRVDVERTARRYNSLDTPQYNTDDTAYRRDIETFSSRLTLGCIVFDSAPYFPSIEKETAAAGILLSSHAMKLIVQTAVVGSHSIRGLNHFNYLGYLPKNDDQAEEIFIDRPDQFWKSMKHLKLSKRHAFIYCNTDNICDCDEMKKIITTHRENGIQIVTETVGDKHSFLKRKLDVYAEFIDKVIDSLDGCILGNDNVSDWFDD